jgi:hypothetical protein
MDENNAPGSSSDFDQKKPAFRDENGYVWHISISYSPGIKRFLLTKPHYYSDNNRQTLRPSQSGLSSLGLIYQKRTGSHS